MWQAVQAVHMWQLDQAMHMWQSAQAFRWGHQVECAYVLAHACVHMRWCMLVCTYAGACAWV